MYIQLPLWFLDVFYSGVQCFLPQPDFHKFANDGIACHVIPVCLQSWIIQNNPRFSYGLAFTGPHLGSSLYSLTFVFQFFLLSVFFEGPLSFSAFCLMSFSVFCLVLQGLWRFVLIPLLRLFENTLL